MTPPAATAAGRTLRRPVAPRAPRRISGPAARPRRGEDARRRTHVASDPFILRALRRTQLLADSRLLDRLIRGRLWIPLVAAGLMGIVFMQVSMLKLNAGIGRAVQSASTLERQNAGLRATVSGMESGTRIEDAANHLGMVVPADGSTHYVTAAARGLATAAAHRMTSADPEAILRAKAATAMAAGQTPGATTTGAAVTQTAAVAPASTTAATATQSTAPTGTTAATPPAPVTVAPAAATTTPPPATTQQPTGATAAPTTTSQPQPAATPAPTQQSTGAPTAATTSGGAVAPPQG